MSTTSLKLPQELKERVSAAAASQDKSAHAFMLEAIAGHVARIEAHNAFVQSGLDALAEVEAGGPLYAAEEVHEWFLQRLQGKKRPRPKPLPTSLQTKRRKA